MTNQKNVGEVIEQKIGELAKEIAVLPHRKTGGLVGAPSSVRSRAVKLWQRSGLTSEDLGTRLGIAAGSLTNWKGCLAGKGRKSPKGAPFRRIDVAESEDADTLPRTLSVDSPLILEIGQGARLTGLKLDDVIRLIGLQGGAK